MRKLKIPNVFKHRGSPRSGSSNEPILAPQNHSNRSSQRIDNCMGQLNHDSPQLAIVQSLASHPTHLPTEGFGAIKSQSKSLCNFLIDL